MTIMKNEGNGGAGDEGKEPLPAARPAQILVVDDDSEVVNSIVRALEHLGHVAASCGHAQDAMDVVARQKIDLLLVDYRMPDMTGLDLVTLLRAEGCQLPIIMMTGHFATEERVPAEQLAIHSILHKPISLPMLARVLEELGLAVREV